MALHPKRKPRDGIDEYGRSPFVNAIIDGEYSKAKQLLAAGADVNLQDDGGHTALFCAVQNQNIDMIEHHFEKWC
jgi:ankyrin repeat protein